MQPGLLDGLGPTAQLMIMGLTGLFIAIGTAAAYFRGAAKEKGGTGVVLAGDSVAVAELKASIDKLCDASNRMCDASRLVVSAVDRADGDMRLMHDAVRDLREEAGKLRGALVMEAAMPRNEEILILLRKLLKEPGTGG